MNRRQRSWKRLDVMQWFLGGDLLEMVAARHNYFFGARQKLSEWYARVRNGGELLEDELYYLDVLMQQAIRFMNTSVVIWQYGKPHVQVPGFLRGSWIWKEGAHCYELIDPKGELILNYEPHTFQPDKLKIEEVTWD